VIVALGGMLGIVSGGKLADRLRALGRRDADLRVAFVAAVVGLPFVILFPLAPSASSAAALLVPVTIFMSAPFGVAPAAIQLMMPNRMRAQATAFYLFVINLLGIGLGPTVVAMLTDQVFRDPKSVHLSLMVIGTLSFALAAILLWLGLGFYRRSLDYRERWGEPEA
jgi:MFS family permease